MFGNDLAIGVSLTMRDAFSAQAATASAAMSNLQNNASALARQQATLARNSNAVGAALGVGLIRGIGKAYKEYADFNYVMRFTVLAADNSTAALDRLSKKALEVGKRTIFSSKEIAEGMKWLAQGGFSSPDIERTIDPAANLAAATMSSLGGEKGAADMLARISTAFKIKRDPTGMERVADVLGVGANKSLTDLTKFGDGMTYAQTTAMRLKMSLEETTAAVMTLTDAGIQGTVTGTTLDNMNRYLVSAASGGSKKQRGALAMLGMTPGDLMDANRNLKPFAENLAQIAKGLKGMGTVDKNKVAVDLFGVRGAKGTEIIDSLAKYNDNLREVMNSHGYTRQMAKTQMDSPLGQLDILKSNWESMKIQFGETIGPLVGPIIKIATVVLDVISKIMSTPIGRIFTMFGTVFIVMRTAQMAYRAILLSIQLLQTRLGTSMVTTAGQTTSSFGTMTTAANAYASSLQRINRMRGLQPGQPGYLGTFNGGQAYKVGPGGGWIPYPSGTQFGFGGKPMGAFAGKASNFLGKYGGALAIGGMLASAGGDALGNDTTAGKSLGVLGDTMGGVGTGAMIGTMFGPEGTLIGGIVGGIGSLMYSLYSRLKDTNDAVKEATAKEKGIITANQMKHQLEIYNKLNYKDRVMLDYNTNMSGEVIKNRDGSLVKTGQNDRVSTTVILQVDGRDIYNKTTESDYVKDILNLGLQ